MCLHVEVINKSIYLKKKNKSAKARLDLETVEITHINII